MHDSAASADCRQPQIRLKRKIWDNDTKQHRTTVVLYRGIVTVLLGLLPCRKMPQLPSQVGQY